MNEGEIQKMTSERNLVYTKPGIVANNHPTGSYAAGCPAKNSGSWTGDCKGCERTK